MVWFNSTLTMLVLSVVVAGLSRRGRHH